MIRFLLKGLLRDRARSLFPVLTVAAGAALTVFLHAFVGGAVNGLIQSTAHYRTGHVRIVTRAYAKIADQAPNDLALLGVDTLLTDVRQKYPALLWTPRIEFGGLLDIPDTLGQTKEQAPVHGMGVDLSGSGSPEWSLLNLRGALVRGALPRKPGDVLIADELAAKMHIAPGQRATLIGSTMNGSMAFANFTVTGTLRVGLGPMDRNIIIADLMDIRQALDMRNGAGEILGFFRDDLFHEQQADSVAVGFNARLRTNPDNYAPLMGTLPEESGLSDYLVYVRKVFRSLIAFFVIVMSIVLWNTGLTGSIRRYGEYGLRLAVGEEKGHVYRWMLIESLLVGVAGSIVGTGLGLAVGYFLQVHGFDMGALLKNNTMMLSDVIRAQVEPATYLIGFLPGVLATLFGSALSGIGIYRRQTSQLFKELET